MRYILLALAIGLAGCAANKGVTISDAKHIQKIVDEYKSQCEMFPYPDVIYVDQCYEFVCKTEKLRVWDFNCGARFEEKP